MKTTPRSRLLLVELICDLVIFALCALVCVALLVNARLMSRESTQLTQAVYVAQSAAETYLSGKPLPLAYTADGDPVYPDPASSLAPFFRATVADRSDGATVLCVFAPGGAEEPIYTLTVKGGD